MNIGLFFIYVLFTPHTRKYFRFFNVFLYKSTNDDDFFNDFDPF